MASSWTAHPLLASPRPPCGAAERHRVQRARPVDLRARSALGPYRNGRARASAVTNGHQRSEEPQVADPGAHAAEMTQAGDQIVVPKVGLRVGQQTGSNRPP